MNPFLQPFLYVVGALAGLAVGGLLVAAAAAVGWVGYLSLIDQMNRAAKEPDKDRER